MEVARLKLELRKSEKFTVANAAKYGDGLEKASQEKVCPSVETMCLGVSLLSVYLRAGKQSVKVMPVLNRVTSARWPVGAQTTNLRLR